MYLLYLSMMASLLVMITFYLPQTNVYAKKSSLYECGFDPSNAKGATVKNKK